MTYQEALDYLFAQLPMFSRIGAAAYKPGLERVIELSNFFGNPEKKLKAIHIAGTNGKGSTSHKPVDIKPRYTLPLISSTSVKESKSTGK